MPLCCRCVACLDCRGEQPLVQHSASNYSWMLHEGHKASKCVWIFFSEEQWKRRAHCAGAAAGAFSQFARCHRARLRAANHACRCITAAFWLGNSGGISPSIVSTDASHSTTVIWSCSYTAQAGASKEIIGDVTHFARKVRSGRHLRLEVVFR